MQESIHVFLQIMQVSLGEESTTPCHYSTSAKEEIIIFTNTATDTCSPAQIVLCAEEKAKCIEFFYRRSKGDSARK